MPFIVDLLFLAELTFLVGLSLLAKMEPVLLLSILVLVSNIYGGYCAYDDDLNCMGELIISPNDLHFNISVIWASV